ncbi:TonB-dependent receptor [Puteibacter caeruleilacunae]|nr:TonB-dependent receptor [Puteibacter caeruleilacunae]
MKKEQLLTLLLLLLGVSGVFGQKTDANVFGDVQAHGKHLPFVSVYLEGTKIGTTTDYSGHYMLVNLPEGDHIISARAIGYKTHSQKITIVKGNTIEINFRLEEEVIALDDVVVTGTKTFKRRTESPVIVNVLDGKTLGDIQASTLSEGLNFQPGLRVETDCQTCNYSQLRMNGLGGAYSQILINSRPVFSPLTGLYGLEQIPANMIEQIEVVRGGGSALYGSSAIGGTVNVLTKRPDRNEYEVTSNNLFINGGTFDKMLNGNINVLSHKRNAGVSLFVSRRDRDGYDHNDDNYTELPQLKNNSFGFTGFLLPKANHKLEFSLSSMYEYRYGGEDISGPAHEAEQAEERTHNVLMMGVDYELSFNDNRSAFIVYAAGQSTDRKHYTGIIPDDEDDILNHYLNPPYGDTENKTYQGGVQLNHKALDFFGSLNTFTVGAEYFFDDVFDEIKAYRYVIDQKTKSFGSFIQSDWEWNNGITLLSGIRFDKHNFVDNWVVNPRFSVLYKYGRNTQFRVSWASGFKAPQSFDTDMHIAFAGGGVSRIRLADGLKEERSNSFSASINYDKPTEHYVWGFTLEGFYTKLNDAFVLEEAGEDEFGMIFEKRNASSSKVQGVTAELRGNYDRKWQLETGITIQTSRYGNAVSYSDDLPALRDYLRTPERYGYYTLTYNSGKRFNASMSGVYTGSMKILHAAGAPELPDQDVLFKSDAFLENNIKLSYEIPWENMDSAIELFGGVKNMFNDYQDDFDTSKNRDSNYVYGPATPRTIFFGIKLKTL